jgi:acyl carrier protein
MDQTSGAAHGHRAGIDSTDSALRRVLGEVLGLAPEQVAAFDLDTGLFGHLPELDSMAVATVLTALEDHFGILIDDADVTAEMFDTLGTLAAFVEGCRRR